MKYINFALLVDQYKLYPVTYTIKQDGTKVIENTMLKGGDMTENQIKELFFLGYFDEKPTQDEVNEYLDSLIKKRKLYHIEIKETGIYFYYGDLTILCKSHKIGISKFTLDRWNFETPFENEICIIRKSELVISTRSVK